MDEQIKKQINRLEQELNTLKSKFNAHQHNGLDDTNVLRKRVNLDYDQQLNVGCAAHLSSLVNRAGTVKDEYYYAISVGEDTDTGFSNKSNGLQLNFRHYPNGTQSFIDAMRKPLFTGSVSVTSGQNTAVVDGFNFTTNALANALIVIYNSSGTFIETQVIASNTDNDVTISGTWGATTNGGSYLIYQPVYFGNAEVIWQRGYFQEGTGGGVRFGVGPTWTSGTAQNGLLYMDATGDLYWRNKSGTATKLN